MPPPGRVTHIREGKISIRSLPDILTAAKGARDPLLPPLPPGSVTCDSTTGNQGRTDSASFPFRFPPLAPPPAQRRRAQEHGGTKTRILGLSVSVAYVAH